MYYLQKEGDAKSFRKIDDDDDPVVKKMKQSEATSEQPFPAKTLSMRALQSDLNCFQRLSSIRVSLQQLLGLITHTMFSEFPDPSSIGIESRFKNVQTARQWRLHPYGSEMNHTSTAFRDACQRRGARKDRARRLRQQPKSQTQSAHERRPTHAV